VSAQERHLLAGRDVEYVDAPGRFARELDDALRSEERGLRIAPNRMCARIARLGFAFARDEARFIFGVDRDAPTAVGEHLAHMGVVRHQEISGRGAHEHFDAGGARHHLKRRQRRRIVWRRADIEGVVAPHTSLGARELVVQRFGSRCRRIGVGHFEHRRHAAQDGRATAALKIFLVGVAGLAEMDLAVDRAG